MKDKKYTYIILILGLLFIAIGFLIHLTNRYRIMLILAGFVMQIIGMTLNRKKKYIIIPIIVLIFGTFLVYIDYLLVTQFDRLPVLAVRQQISSKAKIYNGAFYRVWKCDISDKEMFVDEFYQSNFYCSDNTLKKIDINEFLLHFEQKYKTYKNEFVKIEGKISEIQGINFLEMKSYTYEADKLNGYVVFDDSVKLRFIFNGGFKNLSKYNVYDNVKVIGKVVELQSNENDEYTIILKDSVVIPNQKYEDFEMIIDGDNRCEVNTKLIYNDTDKKYYMDCINKFEIKYSEEDIYDLEYLIQDKKIVMSDIYKKANSEEKIDENGTTIYRYNDFSILKCNTIEGNKDIIFGNTNLMKRDEFCFVDTTPEESDEVVE